MPKKKSKIIDDSLKFYEFSQNNSGGSFTVTKDLCHRLFIEAKSEDEAIDKAEQLGCYWNGCEEGMDCDCCGDRWHSSPNVINLTGYGKKGGYEVGIWSHYKDAEALWFKKYGHLPRLEEPKWVTTHAKQFKAPVVFINIEQYAQFMADEYGWTTPDVRIFYADGTRKEIFMNKIKE